MLPTKTKNLKNIIIKHIKDLKRIKRKSSFTTGGEKRVIVEMAHFWTSVVGCKTSYYFASDELGDI